MIRTANKNDAHAIAKIANSVYIDNVADKDNGFLMSENISEKYYAELIHDSNYCLVDETDNKIHGFLIAYPKNKIKRDNEFNIFLLDKEKDDFIYIFQIAIRPEYQRHGIGRNLYTDFLSSSAGKKVKAITAKSPLNRASRIFHLKLGFKDVEIFEWNDGVESYVYNLDN